jgi:diguanylate cyclase (GGDEF)-like protein
MFAVLFLDLDRFKLINDSLGHNLGDKVLVEVARQLGAGLRPGDTLARLGGDEFAIVLDEIGGAWRAVLVAERLQRDLKAPIQVDGHQLYLSSSTGVAVSGESCAGPEEMLRDADTAMFGAKQRGRARVVLFDEQMHRDAVTALDLERELRQAIDQDEFAVFYQPVVRLPDRAIVGYEALVRWRHPARGLLKPEEFLHVAEETGLITQIDDWMLRQALTQLRDWSARTGTPPSMYINLSGRSLLEPGLVSRVETLLRETKVDPLRVRLELTEGTFQAAWETAGEHPASRQAIESLRGLRVGLCLDDFGTGYSSLSRLSELPITHVKMDRSFVSRLCSDARDAAVARTIVVLARTMGAEIIAEGVETEEQAAALSALGCEYAQGYLFSEPMSGDLAGEWVPE